MLERSALRTTFAIVTPLIIGQLLGEPVFGLLAALGAFDLCIADKDGATSRTMITTIIVILISSFLGTLLGNDIGTNVALTFVVTFIGGLSIVLGTVPGNIGFVASFVFIVASGSPGDLVDAIVRTCCFGIGAGWASLVTAFYWYVTGYTALYRGAVQRSKTLSFASVTVRLTKAIESHSPLLIHSLRISTATSLSVFLYKYFELDHGYWLALTTLIVLKPELMQTQARAIDRMIGSILGGFAALILALFVSHIVVIDLCIIILCYLAYSQQKHSYKLFVFYLTPFIVLMIDSIEPGNWKMALIRIANTLIGGAIGVAAAYSIRSRKERSSSSQSA